LIGKDIIGAEQLQTDIPKQRATIGACEDAKMPLVISQKDEKRFRTSVFVAGRVEIPPQTAFRIPVSSEPQPIPASRDFEFRPEPQELTNPALELYSHLADHKTHHMCRIYLYPLHLHLHGTTSLSYKTKSAIISAV
jgi:hypothetical protein